MVNRPLPPAPQPKGAPQPVPKTIPQPPRPPHGIQPVKHRRKWWIIGAIAVFLVLLAGSAGGGYLWYAQALEPRDPQATKHTRVTVEEGSSAAGIGALLEEKEIIKSALAFQLYARNNSGMQAGGYALSPAMSVQEIVQHLEEGKFDEFQVTILPGSTIWDVKDNLVKSGFSQAEVDKALNAEYDHPLLKSKPANASLEGYIFPDTYKLNGDSTVEELFTRTFDELYDRLQTAKLHKKFAKHDLTQYQALTLASIIQKEVASPEDERQVAQIFYKRLAEGVPLGADATFIYGAKVLGVEPRVTLDSPYNTRHVKGLPPGPIANMAFSALEAAANPAEGDYLYFVSGDDGKTYFTRTLEEHEAATAKYCRENCDIFQN